MPFPVRPDLAPLFEAVEQRARSLDAECPARSPFEQHALAPVLDSVSRVPFEERRARYSLHLPAAVYADLVDDLERAVAQLVDHSRLCSGPVLTSEAAYVAFRDERWWANRALFGYGAPGPGRCLDHSAGVRRLADQVDAWGSAAAGAVLRSLSAIYASEPCITELSDGDVPLSCEEIGTSVPPGDLGFGLPSPRGWVESYLGLWGSEGCMMSVDSPPLPPFCPSGVFS